MPCVFFSEGVDAAKVSDCPLNGPVEDLLLPLRASEHLARVDAKRANLSGRLPDIDCLKNERLDGEYLVFSCGLPLAKSLQALDLSGNKITFVDDLRGIATYISLAENPPTTLAADLLRDALKRSLQLDLTGTAIADTAEIRSLFSTGALQMTPQVTSINASGGYGCHGVTSASLRISPHLFWPQGLCACLEGYQGHSTTCRHCGRDTFNDAFNSSMCRQCPANSSSLEGATSISGCRCNFGRTRVCSTKNRQGIPI